ncbi:MAG: hypothetical protein JSS42_07830 [Proteobacteria bacterium]|uniref:hypothetical protein n=1 Tax=Rudaea sp. TaxID=2136325 RepID=UPI00321F6E10|nr:hypothetical protein [Pseudomonadota bacterium]
MSNATRLSVLEAMGIDVYALRTRADAGVRAASALPSATTGDIADAPRAPRLAIVCARGIRADARLARLFRLLPQTFGIAAAAIEWLEAGADGELAGTTDAPGYLVIGAAMARALGVQLSTMQQNATTIAVTAEPSSLPGTAADKRALWHSLKPLARRLRGAAA